MIGASQLSVGSNLLRIRERIEHACRQSGRKPDEVKLLLATKTVPAAKIMEAVAAGETLLGENRVQELQEKAPALSDARVDAEVDNDIEWHFIGHLQTNKVRHVIRYATCIHSIDRLRLGQRLHNRLTREGKQMDILVQVNTSYEDSKFGVPPEGALELVEQLSGLNALRIKGLMTIGKFGADERTTRECFQRLRHVQERIAERNFPGVEMDVLSMGMSGDLEWAIAEGSTLVRVGTAVFGERMFPDSYYWNEQ